MGDIWARQALTELGWQEDVRIGIDDAGRISAVESGHVPLGYQVDILLPAPVNVHSHAFQRAMAGLTERRGPTQTDSFWTWRQLMFRFLDQLTPVHVEAITAFVQMEMLEAGYATHVEFHYLHHQSGGNRYDDIAEMSTRIIAAASLTGIGLTLLPVYYQFGGCDGRDLGAGQIRFGNDPDQFARLYDQAHLQLKQLLPADAQIGVAPHSLRAVSAEGLTDVIQLAESQPIQLHLAEQLAEVDELIAQWGKRPVEWLLENVSVDHQWCLIHCTQMQAHETRLLAQTGAVAGLCPITESSLGDGIFDAVNWLGEGGRIAIGSDSNIRITLNEELRTLDYTQRLRDHTRAALATGSQSTGRRLLEAICDGGAQAAARESGRIRVGAWADLLALDSTSVDLAGRTGDTLLDSYIFAGDDRLVNDVWTAGRHQVQNGKHLLHEQITRRYISVMSELAGAL